MINPKAPLLALLFFWSLIVVGQVAVPVLTGHVIDQTGTLTRAQQNELEQILRAFEATKGSQLAVLIVPTTEPEAIEEYALRVAEQWKLGRKKVDDGVLLLIAKNDRKLRIEVGYGLEGALNDATAKRIIAETISPHFKQGDFNGGVTAGVEQIIRVIEGEPLPAARKNSGNGNAGIQQYLVLIVIFAFVIGGILRAILGKFFGALAAGGVVAFIVWLIVGALSIALIAGVIALVITLLGGGGRSGFGGGGFGGGGFGGGGGFSGGGGSFGGGGASGNW